LGDLDPVITQSGTVRLSPLKLDPFRRFDTYRVNRFLHRNI